MAGVGGRALRIAAAVAMIVAAGAVGMTTAHASLHVTRFDDPPIGDPSGGGSLRDAIIAANQHAGPDSIVVQPGTYTLTIPETSEGPEELDATQGDLDLVGDVTFWSPGGAWTVDAGARFTAGADSISMSQSGTGARVFHVSAAAMVAEDLTVTGGSGEQGAGIYVFNGSVDLAGGAVDANVATGTCCGGGIKAVQSDVTLGGTTVEGNAVAQCCGGGIYGDNSTVTLRAGVRIVGNDAIGCCGGGLYSTGAGGRVTSTETAFYGNAAQCCGGAVYNESVMTLERGPVAQNHVRHCCAGGVAGTGASVTTLRNVTVSRNDATTVPAPGIPTSGGVYVGGQGQMTLDHVTVTENWASPGAGGIGNGTGDSGAATLMLRHSIVAGNEGFNQCLGQITSARYNIVSDGSCRLTHPTDRQSTNAMLDSLTAAGYHLLLPGSPAIDMIATNECPPPSVDQIGEGRPQDHAGASGNGCDAGAIEMPGTFTTPSPATPTPTPTPTTSTPTPIFTPTPTPTPNATSTPTPTPGATPTPTPMTTATPTPTGPTPTPPGVTASPTATPAQTPPPVDPRCDDEGVICGTDAGETITGTDEGELIICGDGDDVVRALGGDDTIECGDEGGDKVIDAGAGDDEVDCDGDGDDEVDGGSGNDDVRCGAGNDTLRGGKGRDHLVSTSGHDTIAGGSGRDRLGGGSGDDALFGGAHGDELTGGRGDDTLHGQRGRDRFRGGPGRDGCDDRRRESARGCETGVS